MRLSSNMGAIRVAESRLLFHECECGDNRQGLGCADSLEQEKQGYQERTAKSPDIVMQAHKRTVENTKCLSAPMHAVDVAECIVQADWKTVKTGAGIKLKDGYPGVTSGERVPPAIIVFCTSNGQQIRPWHPAGYRWGEQDGEREGSRRLPGLESLGSHCLHRGRTDVADTAVLA